MSRSQIAFETLGTSTGGGGNGDVVSARSFAKPQWPPSGSIQPAITAPLNVDREQPSGRTFGIVDRTRQPAAPLLNSCSVPVAVLSVVPILLVPRLRTRRVVD